MNILSKHVIDTTAFSKNWGWFLVWGILLFILGLFAISYAALTTLLSVVFLGFLIFASSIVVIFDSFTFWWGRWRGFFIHLLVGILYLFVGIVLISNPIWASISLTLFLAIFYIIVGIFRIFYYLSIHQPKSGWNLFSGIIALLLGFLILFQWPMAGLLIIGLFVGIDLLILGWAYIMAALAARSLTV